MHRHLIKKTEWDGLDSIDPEPSIAWRACTLGMTSNALPRKAIWCGGETLVITEGFRRGPAPSRENTL